MCQACCLGAALLIRQRIVAAKDTGAKVEVPAVVQFGQEVKPAATLSVPEYDLTKFHEMITKLVMTSAICCGINYQWGYFIPLILQVVMTPLTTLDDPLSKVHLLKMEPKGNLKRPWPAPDPFGGLTAMMKAPQTTQKAASKANKSAKLEAKKEKAKKK